MAAYPPADRTENMGETYRWVDAARHEASTLRLAWDFPDGRSMMAYNLRLAARVLIDLAAALSLDDEVDGKDAIDAILEGVPEGSGLALPAAHVAHG